MQSNKTLKICLITFCLLHYNNAIGLPEFNGATFYMEDIFGNEILKKCCRCKEILPLKKFYKNKNGKYGKHSYCSDCQNHAMHLWIKKNRSRRAESSKDHYLKRRYGITLEKYNEMLHEQDYKCAICGCPERSVANNKTKSLSVDHNHITGQVRKLLCQHCNNIVGYSFENVNILKNAIKYITDHAKYGQGR